MVNTSESNEYTGAFRLGKYWLIAELGRGGMAHVHLAVVLGPAGFSKLVVVKELRHELVSNADFVEMFLDEARLAARLRHPNVVQTTEVGEEGGRYYMVMEYLEGQTLNKVFHQLRGNADWSIPKRVRVITDMLSGLHYAHELREVDGTPLGVVHRDVSPHNVFVTYDGQIKLMDFGVAKSVDASHETRAGVFKGKVAYVAPEQIMGNPVDRRADVYSAGVMLWEALAGRRMWKGVSDVTTMHNVLNGQLPDIREVRPDTPAPLVEIVDKALQLAPERRYQTALAMQEDLEAWLQNGGHHLTSKDVGKLVSAVFAEDRESIAKMIEGQIRFLKEEGVAEPIRLVLDSGPGTSMAGSGSYSNTKATRVEGHRASTSQASGTVAGVATPDSLVQGSSRSKSKRLLLVLAGITLLAAISIGTVLFWLREPPTPAAAAAATPIPASSPNGSPATSEPSPQRAATIVLRLEAHPRHASWTLDGAPLQGNPFVAEQFASTALRRLEVRADGFEPVSREVVLDRDTTIALALVPSRRGRPAAPTVDSVRPTEPAAAPPATTESALEPAKRARPPRPMDTNNPYATP